MKGAWLGAIVATALVVGACGETKMTMDGTMKGEMKGDLNGAFKLEGPIQIQMQMQGPTVKYEGTFVSEKLLEHVKVGETRSDWLVAVFGEPTSRAVLGDGSEIWKWSYRPLEAQGSVFSVFGGGAKDEPKLQQSTTFVRLNNSVVIEKWRD
ncbi:MAG: hypothetical protein ACREJO_12265 [Phycisphaerales bacterium]